MKPLFLCALLGSLALAQPAAAQTAPPPVEAFGRLPAVADVAISPDGTRIALATSQVSGQTAITIVNLDQPSQRTSYGGNPEEPFRALIWVDNERVGILLSHTFHASDLARLRFVGNPRRIDYTRWAALNTTTGSTEFLTIAERDTSTAGVRNPENQWADFGSDLVAPIEGDPGFARLIGNSNNWERPNAVLYRVHLDSGRSQAVPLYGINEHTGDYILGRDGSVAGRLDTDYETNRWQLYTYDGPTPRLLLEDESRFGGALPVWGLLPDGRFVAVRRNETGHYALLAINRSTGESEVLQQAQNADVSGAIIDPRTREVVGARWAGVGGEARYFQPDLQSVRDTIAGALPDSAFSIVDWSQDRSRFIIYAERGLDGGAYYLFNRTNNRLSRLAPLYPELNPNLGQRQSITYRARDGTPIPAYLTLPAGAQQQNLPLVLLVHGGPHGVRDTMDFDWWSTFLVSRGYAVLQPNFRGSGGYGQAWEEAGRRQWGDGVMQTDVEDGVAALIEQGVVDANRVCIVGASYGGYAALAGATITPDRYRCAVSVAGVSDLELMMNRVYRQSGADDDTFSNEWWGASIGDRDEDRARIRAVSPANLADRVHIPILLIHGTDDTQVPIEQSRRMRDAMQRAGAQVRFVELRGDDHNLSDAPTRIQMLREIETFLAQNIGSGAPAQPPAQ